MASIPTTSTTPSPKPPDNFTSRPLWSAGARSRFDRQGLLRDFAETFPCFRRMHPTSASPPCAPQIRPSPAKHFFPRPPVSHSGGRLAFTPALVGGRHFSSPCLTLTSPAFTATTLPREQFHSVGTPAGFQASYTRSR